MSSHTPGPWKYSNEEAVDGPYVYAPNACGVEVASAGQCMIAGISGYYNIEAEESHANARLIAAAPEMYDIILDIAGYKLLDGEYPLEAEVLNKMADILAKIRGGE